MLIVMSGLPGTGKTTVARHLARLSGALHLRIDTIEQAIVAAGGIRRIIGAEGYLVAYGVARDNLRLGAMVIADCVNPLKITRHAWRAVAEETGVGVLEVELVCSNEAEHRRRVETRRSDIEGLQLPRWKDVCELDYEAWSFDRLVIDTGHRNPEDCAADIAAALVDTSQ